MNGIHLFSAFLKNWIYLPHLFRRQLQLGLQTKQDVVANRLAIRRVRPSFLRARPAQDSAGNSADEKDCRQIDDNFILGQVVHGNMLTRRTESAIATELGSRSFNV